MTISKSYYALLALLLLGFTACKKDNNDTTPDNEEEVITTVTVSVADSSSGRPATRSFSFRDPDGAGGAAPTIDTIRLYANTSSYSTLTLKDESTSPASDITPEIQREKNVHQFFYVVKGGSLQIAYDPSDYDSNVPPKPLGLKSRWRSGATGKGSLRIVLKHQPDLKPTINNAVGDSTLGETDVEVVFPYRID